VKYFWGGLGWVWSKKKFIGITLCSTLMFFGWFFPCSDLSDLVTSLIARGTGGQVYVQFASMDLNLLPTPAVSADGVSIETPALPSTLEARWLKISPNVLGLLFNPLLLKRAAGGDPEAANKLQMRLGGTVAAEGVLGGDVDVSIGPGSKSEGGAERSKLTVEIEKVNLKELSKWASLSLNIQGQANFNTIMQFTPGFAEQPEGELDVRVNKFNLPASTIMVPLGEAMMPINVPTLTLANVVMKGRLVGGSLIIEEGAFGQNQDPIHGRMKGQIAMRVQPMGPPILGAYNLTLDLSTNKMIEKELGFAFLLFDSAKTPTSTGSRYLFRAQGQGIGPQYPPPTITRINSF